MNQTFSTARFNRLLRKYFTDNQGQLLANVGLLISGLFVVCVFAYQGLPGSVNEMRYIVFFVVGWSCWYVFTVQQINVLNQKERAMNYLLQPASQFEKFALIWLVAGLGFVLVYGAIFTVFDSIGVWVVNHRNWAPEQLTIIRRQGGIGKLDIGKLTSFFQKKNLTSLPEQVWVFTALLPAFTMVFSLIVRRYTLPIVVVIAFALVIFGFLGNNFLLHMLTGSEWISSVSPFAQATAQSPLTQYDYRAIELPQPLGNQLRYSVGIIALILLYITAYVRLKEREV